MSSMTDSFKGDRSARPSPLACTECRRKHLKCDAVVPVCSRCTAKGMHCSYTPSRRGISSRMRKAQSPRHPAPSLPPTPAYEGTEYGLMSSAYRHAPSSTSTAGRSLSEFRPPSPRSTWTDASDLNRLETGATAASNPSTPVSTSSRSSLRSEDEHLTNLYYSHFHPSHPLVVPPIRYSSQAYPQLLKTAMKFVGSHYASNISSDHLRAATAALIADNDEKTPETVQALLLYSMALHARYEPMEAMPAITKAADLAIELGMNHANFAPSHSEGDAVYEESLRRTWWELYVADGYLAALHRHDNFRSNTVPSTTFLPCEEHAYNEGNIPSSLLSLQQFDGRLFSDDEYQFSSFCYRIDAVRILSRVLAVSSTNDAHADAIQAIDNAVAGWKFHLPNTKAGIIDHSGEMDHIMFQAYMIVYCASIFLHFPRSELPITMPPAAEITCARQHMEQVSPTSTQHAVKAMAASKDLANLAALPMEKHSPFFICGLVFACIVQLSACSAYPRNTTPQNRDRVALLIGVLKSFSRHWAIAQYVSGQLKRAANEIFFPKADAATVPTRSPYDSGVDLTTFPSDLSWLDWIDGMPTQFVPTTDLSGM